jgi:hypothetical protein
VIEAARAALSVLDASEFRLLVLCDRAPADPSSLAEAVDGLHRGGRLEPLVWAWLFAGRRDPFRIDCAAAADLLAAAADAWRWAHPVEQLGVAVEPAPPDDLAELEPFGRLLALAASAGVVVEWRSLPYANGLAGPGHVVLRPGAGVRVLAHELAHVFDPRPWGSVPLLERERFADELGVVLVEERVLDPVTARRRALDVLATVDLEDVSAGVPAPAAVGPRDELDVDVDGSGWRVERGVLAAWFERLAR